MEYKYVQNANAEKPIIVINGYIGADSKGDIGIEESQLVREILALKNQGVEAAEMWINSKGGLWSSSVGIVSAMNNSGIKFTTRNMGFCDSAGGHLFQAGAERIWNANAVGLVHEVQGFASEQIMEAMNASVATMLCGKTKQTTEQVRVLMKAETMIDHKMAYDLGFCDNAPEGFNILQFTNSSEAVSYGEDQIKKSLPKSKNMEAINAILGLQNEASEKAQLEAINKIITARNEAETKLTAEQSAHVATQARVKVLTGDYSASQAAILTVTNENKALKADKLIADNIMKIGDKPEAQQVWREKAIADYATTAALLAATNVNAQAPDPLKPAVGVGGAKKVLLTIADYNKA